MLAPLAPLAAVGCSSGQADAAATGEAAATATTASSVTFKALDGQYLGAQGGGGSTVIATATAAQAWEDFSLVDQNGGDLVSGDYVFVKTSTGAYWQAANGGRGALNAASGNMLDWESFRIVKASGSGKIASGDVVGLQTKVAGTWVSVINGGGSSVVASGAAMSTWEQLTIGGLAASAGGGATPVSSTGTAPAGTTGPATGGLSDTPDFGASVFVFDPSMAASTIQAKLDAVFKGQESNQFGTQRYAYLFKPGKYALDVQIGFYMQALGLGASPDDVSITGAVGTNAAWAAGNATQNFWRGAENMAVTPTSGNTAMWAVSQATSLRRFHVVGGGIMLFDPYESGPNNWSSGGFIADSKIDGTVSPGSQQQFLTRNVAMNKWDGGVWNMVFVGDQGAPSGAWPGSPFTIIDATPTVREKPYLVVDGSGKYSVKVPALRANATGTSWSSGTTAGASLPMSTFYVAHAGSDTAATMNAALAAGHNLLLTPGIYALASSLQVSRAGTVVLGLGQATLQPTAGSEAVTVADVDGVSIAGVLFDAGPRQSPTLLRLGGTKTGVSHAQNPTALFDIACRVGGAAAGTTSSCVTIESNDVIVDNAWLWRADHGSGVGWDTNPAKNGILVDGDDVTAYGLFVEHFEEYQTLWSGNNGRVYFYQSEIPYDVPSQGRWTHDGVNGYASFKVQSSVTKLDAQGLGVYCVFNNPVVLENAIETPATAGVSFHHMVTEWLGVAPGSSINHIINGTGAAVTNFTSAMQARSAN